MDFIANQLFDGLKFRALTLVDNFGWHCMTIRVVQPIKDIDVASIMEDVKNIITWYRKEYKLTTGVNLSVKNLTSGPMRIRWYWITHDLANRQTIPLSNHSMEVLGMSVKIQTGSYLWKTQH